MGAIFKKIFRKIFRTIILTFLAKFLGTYCRLVAIFGYLVELEHIGKFFCLWKFVVSVRQCITLLVECLYSYASSWRWQLLWGKSVAKLRYASFPGVYCIGLLVYTRVQNVWSGLKSVVTFGLIKILTHPC